jgi:hypothetical protein
MPNADPRTWLDTFVGACIAFLAGAVAVTVAVRLLLTVWVALIVILGIGLFAGILFAILRTRRQGW